MVPNILFEDSHLIVLNKPAGLLSQGEISGDANLVDWLRVYLGRNYVGLVHRLDRNTSGAMIVAKRTKAARRLTEALQKGELARSYLAIVEGDPPTSGQLENWLVKNSQTNEVSVVSSEKTAGAKKAILFYENLEATKPTNAAMELSLLRVNLDTGRSHQIRVQLAYAGWPLLGDTKYGSASRLLARPALHSYVLTFPHPMTGERLEFEAPLPPDLSALLPRSKP